MAWCFTEGRPGFACLKVGTDLAGAVISNAANGRDYPPEEQPIDGEDYPHEDPAAPPRLLWWRPSRVWLLV
jgi:hypothetical protein